MSAVDGARNASRPESHPRRPCAQESSRVAVTDVVGIPPWDVPPLPAGLRVARLRASVDALGCPAVLALASNGILIRYAPGRDEWDEVGHGVRRVRTDRGGEAAALLHADGTVALAAFPPGQRPTTTRLAGITSAVDLALVPLADGTPVVYVMSRDGELTAHRGKEARVVDGEVAAIASSPDPHGRLVYASRGQLRRGSPDGFSVRLGPRPSRGWGRPRSRIRSIVADRSMDDVEIVHTLDRTGDVHVWSSDAPAYRPVAAIDVIAMAPRLSATRSLVATRSRALWWIHAGGYSVPVGAGPLLHGVHPVSLRATPLSNEHTALYALGDRGQLYGCDPAETRWRLVQEKVDAFDVLPHGGVVTAARLTTT